MALTIQLTNEVEALVRNRASASGLSAEVWLAKLAETVAEEDWEDPDFANLSPDENDEEITLERVREILSKIPGKLSDDCIADREERFR